VRSPRVVAVRRLQQRKDRDEQRRFLAEGPQAVREALARPGCVETLYLTADCAREHPGWHGVVVPDEVLAAMAQTRSPQGVLAVCRQFDAQLPQVLGSRLAVVLHEIRDPGNAGTVLRAADAAGAGAVVFSTGSVDPYNGKCVRATAGSLFHVPLVREAPTLDAIAELRAAGLVVLAADGSGTVGLYDLLPPQGLLAGRVAWVFGNEARGLGADVLAAVDHVVAIPHDGPAESLNLAAAAAVCLLTTAAAQHGRVARPVL
jgi:TrmH family RNA methyltransferase